MAPDPHVNSRMAECLQLQRAGHALALCKGCQFVRDAFATIYRNEECTERLRAWRAGRADAVCDAAEEN